MGTNNFLLLPLILPGTAVGPQASIDLYGLVSPTGLEKGFTILCSGRFKGTVAIEGSLDGVGFNPIGSSEQEELVGCFRVDDLRPDSPVEFSPLISSDTVRYVRARLMPGTTVFETVTISIGGAQNCECSEGGGGIEQLLAGPFIELDPANGLGPIVEISAIAPTVISDVGATSDIGNENEVARADHVHQGVHQIEIEENDTGLNVTPDPGVGDVVLGQVISANWPVANFRVYAVDFVSGDDNNKGYADATAATQPAYAAAVQAAGAVAKKTFAGLGLIFPRLGNGRFVEVVIANGGTNTEQVYAGSITDFLAGVQGYAVGCPIVRGTGTEPTAGVTKFDGSAADIAYMGAVTAAGCNSAGYNPNGSISTTSVQCLKVGGGAAAIPIEPASPLGWRMRFSSSTTTAALRNVCRMVSQVSGTDTLIPLTAWPATPVASDTFFLEMGGYVFTTAVIGGGPWSSTTAMQICGARATATISVKDADVAFKFCGANLFAATTGGSNICSFSATLVHPFSGNPIVGGTMRTTTSFALSTGAFTTFGAVVAQTSITIFQCYAATASNGVYAGTFYISQNNSLQPGTDSGTQPNFGSATVLSAPRIGAGQLRIIASLFDIGGSVITGAAAAPAILVRGRSVVTFSQGVCSGSTGNNDVGMDLTQAHGSLIVIIDTPTVTGALGNIRLAGGQIITWAQAIATGIVDSAGNRIIGPSSTAMGMETKTGGLLYDPILATFSWMADETPTTVVAGINEITPVRYSTSQRIIARLRATVLVVVGGSNITVTLYKNNVATTQTVTIPALSAVGTKVVDIAHPIIFADGDDWGLRIDGAAEAEGGHPVISATVEWYE